MSLPIKLDKVTLIDVVTEFKFENRKAIEDLFFEIYANLKPKGFHYTKLPIMELPTAIREGDEKLKHQPHYRMNKGKFFVSLGPQVLSFSISGYYDGWDGYKKFILENIEEFSTTIEELTIKQISMRYINLFEDEDIFDKLNISMEFPSDLCADNTTIDKKVFYNEISCNNDIKVRMNISNKTEIINGITEERKKGTIIDIDAYINQTNDNTSSTIGNLHSTVKKMFFGLLKEELITSLNPTYK
jgi:uncharacterized protein (TIGR04255 family)